MANLRPLLRQRSKTYVAELCPGGSRVRARSSVPERTEGRGRLSGSACVDR